MRQMLLGLIGIALLQTVLCLLTKDEKYRSMLRIAGGIAMVTLLLSHLISFDFDAYASALRSQEFTEEVIEKAKSENDRLNRMLIEQECAAYILNKAAELDAPLSDASVSLSWDTDGFWYPSAAVLTIPDESEQSSELADAVQTDLGIPFSSLVWREEGTDGF